MSKTILITGATDGIGAATARLLAPMGHRLLLHGRSPSKLERICAEVNGLARGGPTETYVADLSSFAEVEELARVLQTDHPRVDVLINNAGVLSAPSNRTKSGLDLRFAVNTIAPYLLTKRLLPALAPGARVVNVSSAAQAPVELSALRGEIVFEDDFPAYAQSKLALMMWTAALARSEADSGVVFVSVNPGSLLGSKMVRENFGRVNGEVTIGAKILAKAALSEEFSTAHGAYWDNDSSQFQPPHPSGRDASTCDELVAAIEDIIAP